MQLQASNIIDIIDRSNIVYGSVHTSTLVAMCHGVVVGGISFCQLSRGTTKTPRCARIVYIELMAVHHRHQEMGVGRELMECLSSAMQATRCVLLFVQADVGSVGFYKKCGFIESRHADRLAADIEKWSPSDFSICDNVVMLTCDIQPKHAVPPARSPVAASDSESDAFTEGEGVMLCSEDTFDITWVISW